MGRGWTVKLLTFVGGTSGSGHREHMEKNLEELQVLKSKWKGIRERLVRRLLEEQDTVFTCYYAAKLAGQQWLWGLWGPEFASTGHRKNDHGDSKNSP